MKSIYLSAILVLLPLTNAFAGTVVYCKCAYNRYSSTHKGYLVGLDIESGKQKWETEIRDFGGYADDKLKLCQAFEDRCPISAYDK